jgi:hypothetical protein
VGDLTGNGRPDLVAVTPTAPQVAILQNNGDGTFTPLAPVSLSTPEDEITPQPDGVVVADLNGDGRPDIAVADYANDTIVVLLNTTPAGGGSPTFAAPQIIFLDGPPTALAVGNLVDGDPRPDLVAAEPLLDEVAVAVNQTDPGSPSVNFATNFYELPSPVAVAVGPFTGSGHQDVVAADGKDATVAVLPGNGDGTFGAPLFGDVPGTATAVAPYSDPSTGLQGFAAATQNGTVTIFGQPVSGSLLAQTTFSVGSSLQALATADVDGDGVTDVVAADAGSNSVDTAAGPFTGFKRALPPEAAYAVGTLPTGVVVADFNGDGAPDLAVANAYSGTVSVLLNLAGTPKTPQAAPAAPTGGTTPPAPTGGTPTPTGPSTPTPHPGPDVPIDVGPTSGGRTGPGTDSPAPDGGDPTVAPTTAVVAAAPVASDTTPTAGGGGEAAAAPEARAVGVGFLAPWSDADLPARSEFGPALDTGPAASVAAVVQAPAEKSRGQARPGPRTAGAVLQDLTPEQGRPADKASVLVASTFDGDDSVALFEAVAKGWATPAVPTVSTAPVVSALLAAADPAPPPDGAGRGDDGAVRPRPPNRLPAFLGLAAVALAGLWFGLVRLRPRTAYVPERRPEAD